MRTDPIIKEIHQNRENIARKLNYDIRKIVEDAKKRQIKNKEKVINLRKNRSKLLAREHQELV